MVSLPGYKILSLFANHSLYSIYRGQRNSDSIPILAKFLKFENISPNIGFRHEYDLMNETKLIDGVATVYEVFRLENSEVTILEDVGGEFLSSLIKKNAIELKFFLKMSIGLSDTLHQLHKRQIIHKDINPSNIIINRETEQIRLTGFNIASKFLRDAALPSEHHPMEGTLAYMSPEQTGRLNRTMDYRTDLYSLGVVLYEILSGTHPFPVTDPLEVMHAHIAQKPKTPDTGSKVIPRVISDIVMRLLEKSPEQRYQSALGLKKDLEKCLDCFKKHGYINNFIIGKHDLPILLKIPDKLYGREKQIELMQSTFEYIGKGHKEVLFISGHSGIGKTFLVNHLRDAMMMKKGMFIEGKYDSLKKNIPYTALIQAFKLLTKQLLQENEAALGIWKNKILAAVGKYGKIITDVIPGIEIITGPQADVLPLPPPETQNRFNITFLSFLKVFPFMDRPLTLFLDDMQWADEASMKLLELIIKDRDLKYFYFIGAFRDNEMKQSSISPVVANFLKNGDISARQIFLGPISVKNITDLLSDTILQPGYMVKDLAKLIFQKTGGNPFFVKEFLKNLYQNELLYFNTEWEWDIQKIYRAGITDNIADLMMQKLMVFPGDTWSIIRIACCIGLRSSVKDLASICQTTEEYIFQHLTPAFDSGILLRADGFVEFTHDKIREAAYLLIKKPEHQALHLQVARNFISSYNMEKMPEEKIFSIVNQMNMVVDLLNRKEKELLLKLNIRACKKAKREIAYASCLKFISAAMDLLPGEPWKNHYRLALEIYNLRADAEYLNTNYEKVNQYYCMVSEKAECIIDKIQVIKLKLLILQIKYESLEVCRFGCVVLHELGIDIPEHPGRNYIKRKLQKMENRIKLTPFWRDGTNKDSPQLTDPVLKEVMQILHLLSVPALLVNPLFFQGLILRMVKISIVHGLSPLTPVAFSWYAFLLCTVNEDMNRGREMAELAILILERYDTPALVSVVIAINALVVNPWRTNFRDCRKQLFDAVDNGYKVGEIVYSCYAASWSSTIFTLLIGKNLVEADNLRNKYVVHLEKTKQADILLLNRILYAPIRALLGKTATSLSFSYPGFQEDETIQFLKSKQNLQGLCLYYCLKLFICYMFENFQLALDLFGRAKKISETILGNPAYPLLYFSGALILAVVYADSQPSRQKVLDREITKISGMFKKWSNECPDNYLHDYLLIKAEHYRITKKDNMAMKMYDRAIEAAVKYEYVNKRAIANECAFRFYLKKGFIKIANLYLKEAYSCYKKWGAVTKIKAMEEQYPGLQKPGPENSEDKPPTPGSEVPCGIFTNIDLATVLKVSRTLSSEIDLKKLLSRILVELIKTTGAQKGALLVEQKGNWYIDAYCSSLSKPVKVLQSVPLEKAADFLPVSIIQYVIRSRECLILDNAEKSALYGKDNYVVNTRARSLLCCPLVNQQQWVSLLYLENTTTPHIFTMDRLEILKLLAAQAAISVKNARLYQEAITDGLTGLFIRRYFDLRLIQEFTRAKRYNRPLSLVIFDVDHFKSVNDVYGHQAGDMLLIGIAKLIRKQSRSSDIPCRYGGEEFAVILPETGEHDAIIFAEKIRYGLERMEFPWEGRIIKRTISAGLAATESGGAADEATLVRKADEALYYSKEHGRNRMTAASKIKTKDQPDRG